MSIVNSVLNWFFYRERSAAEFRAAEYSRGYAAGQWLLHNHGDPLDTRLTNMTSFDRGFSDAIHDYRRKQECLTSKKQLPPPQ